MRRTLATRAALALALLDLGCASVQPRKHIGRATLAVSVPLVATQAQTSMYFTLQEGRILTGGPQGSLDLVADPDGCLRGTFIQHALVVCPQPAVPREPLVWQSASDLTTWSAELRDRGKALWVRSGLAEYRVLLPGKDAVSEAIRDNPELLGAAFAYGLVPPAKDFSYTLAVDAASP